MVSTAVSSQLNMTTVMNTTTWRRDPDADAADDDAGDEDEDEVSEAGRRYHVYILLVVYPLVFLFGVFGNTLVITVVLKYISHKSCYIASKNQKYKHESLYAL